jgi:Carboxypeptidase regulatory-like domain
VTSIRIRLNILITLIAIALLVSQPALFAQGTATISGTTADTTRAAIADASMVLTNSDTNQVRRSVSSSDGFFQFTDLTPGHYVLDATKDGYKTWRQTSITLEVAQQITLYPELEIGSVSENVKVTDEPPAITTSNSNLSQVVASAQILDLPLNGRNALQLLSLIPGVVPTGTAGQFGATQLTFASSGGRDIDTNYTLDGGYNENPFYAIANPYPNPDALQEFAVVTRNYSAMFGKGSTDVSAVTRSGTNRFHGSAFEFLRDTSLDATPYFTKNRPTFQRNQFGGAVGGPILRNKLFFFASYQGTQQSGGPGTLTYTTVPVAQRTGDFSALSKPVIDPNTGRQFPGNVIPSDRITSQASAFYASYLPAPNQGPNTYAYPDIATLTEHQGIAKVDYQLSQRDLLFVRYFMDDLPQVNYAGTAIDPAWLSDEPTRFQNTTVGEVHTFSSNLLNNFHFSYVRSTFGVFPRLNFSLVSLGYGIHDISTTQYGLTPYALLSLGGVFTAYTGAPTRDIAPTTHISDNFAIQRGNHSIDIGGELYRNRINELQNYYSGGGLTFNGQTTGSSAADFLLGKYSAYKQIGTETARLHQVLPSFYAQDNIKVARRLTLNVGVRWDVATGFTSEDGQLMTLQPGKRSTVFPLATPGLLFPGDAGVPKDVIGTRWNNIAPRVGFAWDVFGDGQTSARVGFGTYFVPLARGTSLNRLALIQPFVLQVNISGGDAQNIFAGAPFNGVDPYPRPTVNDQAGLKTLPFVPTASESSLPTTFKTEADYEWSLSLQQAVWKKATFEANYVGSSSSHLTTSAESNPAVYLPGASTTANTQNRRLYPQIGSVNSILNVLSANYNALQIAFNQQAIEGVFIKSAYTWSKALGVAGSEGEGSNGPRDPLNYRLDYAPLSMNLSSNWVTSAIWKPLASRHFGPAVNALIGGWQLGGISTVHSGQPINLTSGLDNSLTGIGSDTPDVVGNYAIANHSKADAAAHWFNPAAFKQNAIGTFGTLGVNTLRGPGYMNVDLNIQKNFLIAERYGIEFRTSMYNAFNHANLNNPATVLTSASFGQITTATDPRVIEFGVRLSF